MLRPADHPRHARAAASSSRQQGVVLLVALIVLVALTLAGVALVRSVDTANLVAGNLSFHQTAVQAGERSTETALAWLQPNSLMGNTTLHNDATGYIADGLRPDRSPAAGQSWDAWWNQEVSNGTPACGSGTGSLDALLAMFVDLSGQPHDRDPAGNAVCYVIDRLCAAPGAPHLANCAREPASTNTGGSQSAGGLAPIGNNRVYYRITTRIAGPRRTVAYIQTIVAL